MSDKPTIELLTKEERQSLQDLAEYVWERLDGNSLGGYSGINRPFYIKWMFEEVIEKYGRRNIGLSLTGEQLKDFKKSDVCRHDFEINHAGPVNTKCLKCGYEIEG